MRVVSCLFPASGLWGGCELHDGWCHLTDVPDISWLAHVALPKVPLGAPYPAEVGETLYRVREVFALWADELPCVPFPSR